MEEKQLSENLIDFFERHLGEVFSRAELAEIFNKDKDNLLKKLRILIKHQEIDFEKISYRIARKLYNNKAIKRGMRVYFLE